MRHIHEHDAEPGISQLTIIAEEPGEDAAEVSDVYLVVWTPPFQGARRLTVEFQHGAVREVGVNGVTNEALVAVVLDRVRSAQTTGQACPEFDAALLHLTNALDALHARTKRRRADLSMSGAS